MTKETKVLRMRNFYMRNINGYIFCMFLSKNRLTLDTRVYTNKGFVILQNRGFYQLSFDLSLTFSTKPNLTYNTNNCLNSPSREFKIKNSDANYSAVAILHPPFLISCDFYSYISYLLSLIEDKTLQSTILLKSSIAHFSISNSPLRARQ